MTESENKESVNEKPPLLVAVEMLLADPATTRKDALELLRKFETKYSEKLTNEKIKDKVADKIISNYSYYAGVVGGATALTGVIPGIGTVVASFGGATADAALSIKNQIEMIMSIATVYGVDITVEKERQMCFIIAGLGIIYETAEMTGEKVSTAEFVSLTKKYITDATIAVVKKLFKKAGMILSKKALSKAIPFGAGVIISFSANKGTTWFIGNKAKAFFKESAKTAGTEQIIKISDSPLKPDQM